MGPGIQNNVPKTLGRGGTGLGPDAWLDRAGRVAGGDLVVVAKAAVALAVAACGVAVAKHGNRGISSPSGSADVLERLGVDITVAPEVVGRCIDTLGVGFLFAQRLHPAMKHAGPTRRALGIRTLFNLLGPLTNPAGVRRQVVGVFDPCRCKDLAFKPDVENARTFREQTGKTGEQERGG